MADHVVPGRMASLDESCAHPVGHPVLVSPHLINCDGTGERQVEGDAIVLCPQLVPETRDIRWTLLPIIFPWRWNFDFVFVAFRVERIHLRELKLETTKIADIPRSVVVRELFAIGCFAGLCEINGADDGVLVPSFVVDEARFQGDYLLHTNCLFLF